MVTFGYDLYNMTALKFKYNCQSYTHNLNTCKHYYSPLFYTLTHSLTHKHTYIHTSFFLMSYPADLLKKINDLKEEFNQQVEALAIEYSHIISAKKIKKEILGRHSEKGSRASRPSRRIRTPQSECKSYTTSLFVM